MKIAGFQKLTLIDYPGKLACAIFLYGCNFRCGFCHNPELVVKPVDVLFSEEEILDFLELRKKYLEGVCITGGEPLLTLDFDFLRNIKALGYDIKIDTNGSYPEVLEELIRENLVDFIAMDIKSSREKYNLVVNSEVDFNKIEESIRIISSFPEYEFRTTIVERFHNKKDIENMMEWLKKITGGRMKKFILQGFKNSGKLIDESFCSEEDVDEDYLMKLKGIAEGYCEVVEVRV